MAVLKRLGETDDRSEEMISCPIIASKLDFHGVSLPGDWANSLNIAPDNLIGLGCDGRRVNAASSSLLNRRRGRLSNLGRVYVMRVPFI